MLSTFSPPPMSVSSVSASRVSARVVTQAVIEGHAKRDDSGVRIRMYLKMQLSPEHTAASVIPLFSEENNIRIVNTAVHPTNKQYAPYAGGPRVNKLLKNASRALALPQETNQSYVDLCVTSPSGGGSSSVRAARQSPNGANTNPPALDVAYTGSISISNFSVCFVLPKHFPRNVESESDEVHSRSISQSGSKRRSSIGADWKQRARYCFVAGLEIIVPYLTVPPADPYLLSIPCPRCLDNKLKLRIFGLDVGPDEEIVRWDLATDPAVNQRAHLWRNSLPAGHAADNDSDTSDAGVTNDGELSVIQGSFQSSDRIRVRWAAPRQSFHSLPMDGLLRASLDRLDAKLLIAVEQVLWHPQKPAVCAGLRLRLQYNATCRGMHFPGVATALAVDVMLDARSQTTTWARTGDHHHPRWTIDAERPAYDGVDRGDSPSHPGDLSRRTSSSSFEGGSLPGSPLSSDHPRSRIPVPAGAASLLNVPLPVDAVADYSFETRPPGDTTTPSRMSSSGISTTSGASRMSTGSASDSEAPASGRRVPAPDMRMSLHVNIDHILPKARNEENIFEYGISGVIDVFSPAAHQSAADAEEGDAPSETVFELPVFRMFQVGEETLQISVVSNVSDPIVINTGGSNSASSSAFPSTPQRGPGPSRAMRRGVQLSCPETARLIVHAPSATPSTPTLQRDRPLPGSLVETPAPADSTSQLRMPRLDVSGVNNSRTRSRAESVVLTTDFETGLSSPERPAVDIDLLPYVDVCVEPLSASRSHSVRIRIPSAAVNSDRLDFRVKTPETATEPFDLDVHLVYCALGGRLIHGRVHRSRKAEDGAIGVPASTDTWISLFLGSPLGVPAELDVLYVAKPSTRDDVETEPIPPTSMSNVCFPSFDTRVAVMRVQVLNSQGCSLHQVERKDWDNFTVRSSGDLALTKFSVTGIFAPSVELAFGEAPVTQRRPITFLSTRTFFAAMLVVFITVFLAQQSGTALAPTPRPQHFPDARPEPHTDNSASVPPPTPSEVFEPAPGNYPTDVQPVSVSPLERVQAALAVKYADLNSLLRSLTTFSILSSLHRWYTGLMTWAEVALNWPNEA